MVDSPKVDLHISTEAVNSGSGEYSITFEAINASGITPDIFVVKRIDDQSNTYSFNRVASLYDIKNLEASSVTEQDSYRVNNFTIVSNSLSLIKEYKDNIPRVVQTLLDSAAKGLDLDLLIGTSDTLTIEGEVE